MLELQGLAAVAQRAVALFWVTIVPVLVASPPAVAADLRPSSNSNCAWSVVGELHLGDVANIETVLASADRRGPEVEVRPNVFARPEWTRRNTICLDSPGGSYSEGVRLMQLFIQEMWGTRIESGQSCYSACAIAFMGGTEYGPDATTLLSRTMDVNANLGFHAPFAQLEQGVYTNIDVEIAFQVAFDLVATMLTTFTTETQGVKEQYIRPSLIAEMLSRHPDEFYMIDTVGKAARFSISLVGFNMPTLSPDISTSNVCNNLVLRAFDVPTVTADSWRNNVENAFAATDVEERVLYDYSGSSLTRSFVAYRFNDMSGARTECVFGRGAYLESEEFNRTAYADVAIQGGGWDGYFVFPPETPLAQMTRTPGHLFDRDASQYAVNTNYQVSSFWATGDGALLALLRDGTRRALVVVRDADGAWPPDPAGRVLFEGNTPDGSMYFGTARISDPYCGRVEIDANGVVAPGDAAIRLEGLVPALRSNSCGISQGSRWTLDLVLIGRSDPTGGALLPQ